MPEDRPEFLPPQPAGPEPELARPPAPPPTPPTQQYAPPGYPPGQPPGWGYPARQPEPDNGAAVAGFVLSIVSGALLFLSAGVSSIVSLACAIFGIVYSRKGKRRVDSGETTRNRGLAQAGFVCGIVAVVLSAIATVVWIIVVVALVTDERFREDFEDELDNRDTIEAVVRIAAAAARPLLS